MSRIFRLPEVLGQTVCRRHVTRQIALAPASRLQCPSIAFGGADRFRVENCRLLPGRPPVLQATVAYRLRYADGSARLDQTDRAVFDLPLPAGSGMPEAVKCFESGRRGRPGGARIRVEALAEAFGPVLCPQTGALILTIGAFFIVRREKPAEWALPDEECRAPAGAGPKGRGAGETL